MTDIQATLIAGIGGAIIGGAIGIIGTYLGTVKITKRQEFNKAADIFRADFIDEIFMLRKNIISGDTFISNIITDSIYIRHEKSKIIFESFLTNKELSGFNKAWEDYKNCENNFFLSNQSYHPADISNRKEFSRFYLNHIEILLNYAKPKIK